ncbi:MAG: cobyric acid synthase [Planctomycetota bacterium]
MTFTHGGHLRQLAERAGCRSEDILDFSANINLLGPPGSLRAVVARTLDQLVHYPDPECDEFVGALAEVDGVLPEEIVVGNGSTELLYALARVVRRDRAVIPVPSYSDYAEASLRAGMEVKTIRLNESNAFALDWRQVGEELRGNEAVFLAQPNNPTGRAFDADDFRRLASAHPRTLFVVDEAFAGFVEGLESLAKQPAANVVVVRSLTKFYAIPGLRLGVAFAPVKLATRIRGQIPPWSVNTLAQAVGAAALLDTRYAEDTRRSTTRERKELQNNLSDIDALHVYPGCANYLLVKLNRSGMDAPALAERLLEKRIAVRVCDNFEGLDERFFRVAVRSGEDNRRLVDALQAILGGGEPSKRPRGKKRAASLMFQGTSSNAGKSILAAAMCRILWQDGVRVAPFKSQNMSLNSFVTRDGEEMGRAQVVQARACRVEPDVRMNPILLKPSSDTGCQVIVEGRAIGNMRVGQYIQYKPKAFDVAKRCYDSLAGEFEAVVLEGAGSPGEVNLKHHDIVNMQMARYAEAPVLLVGDIDRGGLFASFIGTMDVLTAWERKLIHGFVINRFRGDASLLGPAIDCTTDHTGKPTLGIVPYLSDLGLPEEDSVEFKNSGLQRLPRGDDAVEVAVIDLPHISNFTDFDALNVESDVVVRIVGSVAELGTPDAVILPGSKSVLGDLRYLRQRGFAGQLCKLSASGKTQIVGVCGGFQMLGRRIADPYHVESPNGAAEGLGLLAVTTALATEKTLARSRAVHTPSGLNVVGYEIHHGATESCGEQEILQAQNGTVVGVANRQGSVWGTYLHGVFDADAFRRWFIDRLRVRRGLLPLGGVSATYDIEPALARLANVVRDSLDIDAIHDRMGL